MLTMTAASAQRGVRAKSELETNAVVELARHAGTTAGTHERQTETATTTPLVGVSAAKAGGEDGPTAEPVGRALSAPAFERPDRRPSKEGEAPEEGAPVSTSAESEETHTKRRETESRVPSLMHASLRAIVKHIPTAVLADNPFLDRLAHSPGDWLLQALVTHLLEEGLKRMNSGLWCGRSRRILRKLQYDLGTERVVAAMRASGVASLESVADVLRIMHEHEYFRCASDMDHRAWELLPALLAPSLKRSCAGGKSSQEQAAQTASIEQESEECVTSLTSFTEYQTASQQQQQQHESNGEARSKKSLRRCPSLQWTGEALWAEPADAGGCSHASVEEVLGDLMARTRTLGFEALLGPLRVRWTVPRATTFLASWLGELEETCGLHDVGIGFDYKRIPLCASRLLAHAGVRRTPAGLNAVVAQVAAAMANCGVAATEDVVGALYASLLMLLRRPREEDQQGNDATGAPLDWAGVGAVLAALEEHFDDCFDMQEVHRYYAGVSLAEFLGHTCRGGPAAFYQATTTLILGYTSRLCRLQPKSSARMHVVARIVSAVSALGLDSVRVLPRAQTAAEATAAGQEGVHAAAAALAAEERVVVSIADSQPMVALAYCLPAAGLLTAGEVGSLLSALAPHARWLPTEAAFLAAEIRKWPLRRAAASAAGSGTNANCVSDSTLGGLFRRGQEEEEEEMESENEERGVASDDEAQSGVARSLTAEAAHSAAAAESGDRASAPPAKRRRVAAPEVAMAAAEGVPLVGNGGDNLAAMMMSLCGPATAWDSRWLHAVIQLLWREGWSWAELGEFSSELLRGEPAEPRR